MKTADFLGIQVTRMILGDNPFNGHSYITDIHSGAEMMDYYTAEKCVRTLFEAEEYGLNTFLPLGDPFSLRVIRQYRNEGGKMNIIFQSYPALDLKTNIWQMMACNPIGIYLHGGTADYCTEVGQIDEIHEKLALIRETGIKTGLGTHVPETLLRAEQEGWDADFYLACIYNARRTQRGEKSGFITGKTKENLVFFPEDPPFMANAIKAVKKPCIAYKIFAGGQIFYGKTPEEISAAAENAIKETFENIKPQDIICVGVYQKFKNQLKENADIVNKILG